MHRSHDREALNESRVEPEPALGSGSSHVHPQADLPQDDAHLELRQRQHDAANWLAVLRGHLDLLAHDPDASASLRSEWLDRARSAASAAERLLRGRSAAEVGGHTHCPLGIVMQDLAGHAHTILPGYAQLALDVELLAPQTSCVLPDDDLEDVLLNLLRNAGQSLGERGGTITLRARPRGEGQVEIEVEDDGAGMSPEVRAQCLAPGFSTRRGSGRGLGLSRVHAMVRGVGGRIEIDSELGRGTRVRLVLAAFDGSSGAPPPTATRPVAGAAAGARSGIPGGVVRVLVVEDDPDVVEVLTALLGRLGCHAVEARSGADARARLRELQFDLVLVDRGLPDLQGEELAREIRQSDPTLAIVLLSGERIDSGPEAAHDLALTKPIGLDGLRNLIEEVLPITRRRRAEAENA